MYGQDTGPGPHGYHSHHTGSAGIFGSSDSHADPFFQGNAEKLGVVGHADLPVDAQQVYSGSQGSTDSHGRSAGSQRSVESHGRSAGSQRSVESHGRSVGSLRSAGSHGRSVGTGSQQSVDSRGNSREALRPEEVYPANAALAETSKKRKVLETPGMDSLLVCFWLFNCHFVVVLVVSLVNCCLNGSILMTVFDMSISKQALVCVCCARMYCFL